MAKLLSLRTLVLAALAAAAAYALKNRSKPAAGGVGAAGVPAPYVPPGPAPAPVPANADVAGPPENTATAVPAPDPVVHEPEGGIDETAETEAAAAEAANIGGPAADYPDTVEPAEAAAAVEAQDDPNAGEVLASELPPPPVDEPPAPDDKSTAVWKHDEQATVEAPALTDEDDNK
ncbi:MAG: hypothetical protein QOF76_3994 [Solirubrobacteraceae bacterium]|jgi:hypothetical protein|nr:hypothetical protein [Solirubrobacteraceae bacterium]